MLSSPPVADNGWGRYTRDLITALARAHVEITLITSIDAAEQPDLPLINYHRVLPSLLSPQRFNALRLLAAMPTVWQLTRSHEVVHVIAEPYILSVSPFQRAAVTAHGTFLPLTVKQRIVGALYRYAYRHGKIICVSTYTERAVKAVIPNAQTTVIANGVNYERFQQPGTAPQKRGPTILSVGQLKARKGFHVLAQAMRHIREAVPDARAIFIGNTSDKYYYQQLQSQLIADNLTDAVHIPGHVSDDVLLGWYHAADVFALPAMNLDGRFEGFGLVYLEANAAGLPVVGTFDCGAEDAIRNGETGYLIPQNDVRATADVLIKLLCDSELRRQLGTTGRVYAQAHSWDSIAQSVIRVYEDLAATSR